jgi:putative transposase
MFRSLFSFLLSLFKAHTQLHLEVLFLRKKLQILARTSSNLRKKLVDRFFLSLLIDLYDSWEDALLLVQPETLLRWHRQSFKVFWKWKSRSTAGRPAFPQVQINLIKQVAADNQLWGAPRIHGELLKLGVDIS